MVVVLAVEAGEEHVAPVDAGIKLSVAVHIGVHDQVGCVRHDHLVVDHAYPERGNQARLLDEGRGLVRPAVAVGVLQHHHAVAQRVAPEVLAVVDALRHPDAALRIDVHVGRVVQQRGAGPDGDLESLGHGEQARRHDLGRRFGGRRGGRDWRGGGLGVEIRGHVLVRHGRADPADGDFDVGEPEDRVEHNLALVVVFPAGVVVAAGEPEAAAALRPFGHPHDRLRDALGDGGARRGIAFMRPVGPAHGARGRDCAQNRRDPAQVVAKAEVKIPFVGAREGIDPARDGVRR